MAPLGIAQLRPRTCRRTWRISAPPVVLAILYSGHAGRRVRQRHRLPRRQAARADPGHRPPVPRPGPGRRDGRDLPRRADPAGSSSSAARSSSPASRSCGAARGRAVGAAARVDRRRRAVIGPDGAAPPVPPLLPGEPPLAILVDYDGTVALTDVSDTVMAEHVPGVWEAEVAAYDAGLMGSRRLMEFEMALVDVAPADAARDGRRAAARSGLRAVRPARPGGRHPGRDRVGRVRLLHRAGPRGARGGGVAGHHGPDDVRRVGAPSIAFPNGHPTCLVCGTCKRNRVLAHQAAGRAVVFIGDGESDRYAAGYATSCGPSGRSCGSASRRAGRSAAGPSSARSTHGWRAVVAAWRADPGSLPGPRHRPVLLRPGGLGRGPVDPPPDAWPPTGDVVRPR